MRFLDWQLVSLGTPVFDLSYFLYSGAGKSVLDKLEHYQHLYYESFSTTLRELGDDPETLYPFSAFQADWKKYCKFGFLLGLMLQRMKLISNDEIRDLHDVKEDSDVDNTALFMEATFDKNSFEERARNLVLHVYSLGAL